MKGKLIRVLGLSLAAMMLLAGCGGSKLAPATTPAGSGTTAGTPAAKVPVKIVLNKNTSNLVPFLAADQKLFEKYGLDVELILASTGSESNEMLASGRADGATLGLGPSVIAWANGQKLVPLVKYRDGADVYSIIVRKDSGIKSIKDLKGKKVAVTKGTDPETAFLLALKAHGLSSSDVKILDAKWADMAALLERGEVDAANANEPFGSIIELKMSDKMVLLERLTPYYGNGGLMLLSESAVEKNPKAAEGVMLAFWEGHKIIREQPDLAVASLKKWLNLDEETARTTLKYFGARPLLTDVTVKDLGTNVDLLMEGKKIRSKPDVAKAMEYGMNLQADLMKNKEYAALLPK